MDQLWQKGDQQWKKKHILGSILQGCRKWKHIHIVNDPYTKVMPHISNITFQCLKCSLLAKILESLMSLQLSPFIGSLDLLQPQQSGFHPGHSRITTALSVIDNIVSSLDKTKQTKNNFVPLFSLTSQEHLIFLITKSHSTN